MLYICISFKHSAVYEDIFEDVHEQWLNMCGSLLYIQINAWHTLTRNMRKLLYKVWFGLVAV